MGRIVPIGTVSVKCLMTRCAKRHNACLSRTMADDFRRALIWHMDKHRTSIADLVRATEVSRDVINKLRAREGSSTTVENAMLIAAFYGKTVNDFVALREVDSAERFAALLALLRPEERRLLEAQIRGLLHERGESAP